MEEGRYIQIFFPRTIAEKIDIQKLAEEIQSSMGSDLPGVYYMENPEAEFSKTLEFWGPDLDSRKTIILLGRLRKLYPEMKMVLNTETMIPVLV